MNKEHFSFIRRSPPKMIVLKRKLKVMRLPLPGGILHSNSRATQPLNPWKSGCPWVPANTSNAVYAVKRPKFPQKAQLACLISLCPTNGAPLVPTMNNFWSILLVFASDAALTQLAQSDTWHMDGTFDSAPYIFQQLYVIRVPLGESAVSCVYAFLSSKICHIWRFPDSCTGQV